MMTRQMNAGNFDRTPGAPLKPLHQVTKNTGRTDRLLLIMSFAEKPGMIGSVERTRELYGKVTSLHLAAKAQRVRADTLMD